MVRSAECDQHLADALTDTIRRCRNNRLPDASDPPAARVFFTRRGYSVGVEREDGAAEEQAAADAAGRGGRGQNVLVVRTYSA